jgi:hypothetical protein
MRRTKADWKTTSTFTIVDGVVARVRGNRSALPQVRHETG